MKLYFGYADFLEVQFWVAEVEATFDESLKSYELATTMFTSSMTSSKWIEERELDRVKEFESIDGGNSYLLISKNKDNVEGYIKGEFDKYRAKLLKEIETLEKDGIKHFYYE